MPFEPKFTITPRIASSLMRIEAAEQAVEHLPITPSVLASDVPRLMADMMAWIKDSDVQGLPCPIRAGIAYYQFATIHPFAKLFTLSQRAARNRLAGWVEQDFLLVADPAKKSRKYRLANEFRRLL